MSSTIPVTWFSRFTRWAWRLGKWAFIGMLSYAALIVIGLFPVNNHFTPSPEGVEIFVVSTEVHADLIVPISHELVDWSEEFDPAWFQGDISRYSHVAIGWGDRGFFLNTRTWADLKLSTMINALFWPSRTCLHVDFTQPEYYTNAVSVKLSRNQYRELTQFIKSTFQRDQEGRIIPIPGYSYSQTDTFFEAHGSYHLFNTCNSWVGLALRKAGVRTPWQSTLPHTPTLYLPE